MKKLSVLLIGIFLLSLGCITVQNYAKPNIDFSKIQKIAIIKVISDDATLELETDEKTARAKKGDASFKSQGTQLAEIETDNKSAEVRKKSAKLKSRVMPLSEIVTDEIILGFSKQGFNIIELEFLRVPIDGNFIINSGLSESDKNILKQAGVDAVIVGSVVKIGGREDKLSLSLKMFDSKSGVVVWRAKVNEVDFDNLDIAVKKLANAIPIQPKVERD